MDLLIFIYIYIYIYIKDTETFARIHTYRHKGNIYTDSHAGETLAKLTSQTSTTEN